MRKTGEMILYVVGAGLVFGLFYTGIGVYTLIKQLCYKMSGISVAGFRKDDGTATSNPFGAKWLDLDLTIKIINPSYLTIFLNSYNFTVYINGFPVADINKNQIVSLLKGSAQVIHVLVSVDLKSGSALFKDGRFLAEFASKQYDQIILSISGTATASLFNIPKKFNISTSMPMQSIIDEMEAPKTDTPQC
jgi:hypothetical protein